MKLIPQKLEAHGATVWWKLLNFNRFPFSTDPRTR